MLRQFQTVLQIVPRMLAICTLLAFSSNGFAWSPGGHSAIGILAMKQLQPEVYDALQGITGPLDDQSLIKACNWPDDVRKTAEWEWSAPQHYINLPHGETEYRNDRDCADGLCATEAVKKYAVQIFDEQLPAGERWQAFAWLCHVTADLHQPMHAAFADDRGGNNYQVVFHGREMNLHSFWDHELIDEFAGDWRGLVALLSTKGFEPAGSDLALESVDQWTEESHSLAIGQAYPPSTDIDEEFALNSWIVAQRQIDLAARRLAMIINSEFERSRD